MPKIRTETSTIRRHKLADFIDSSGEIMVKPCATCKKHKRVCKVHVRSGKCSECLRRGQRCDLQVTQSEWERLKAERVKLRSSIKEAHEAQEKAREELNVAFAREMRLRQQLDLLEKREAEAIAVEEANIEAQESEELLLNASLPPEFGPLLSPETWNAMEGGFHLDDEFWSLNSAAVATSSGGSS